MPSSSWPLLAALLAITLAPACAAQAEALDPTLELGIPFVTGEAEDGVAPSSTAQVSVPWTLTFSNAALASTDLGSGEPNLHLALACDKGLAPAELAIPLELVPGQTDYTGTAILPADFPMEQVGWTAAVCTATGTFTGARTTATDTAEGTLPLMYQALVTVTSAAPNRTGGPAKQIPYQIELRNDGVAPTRVDFELAGPAPKGGWILLLPEPVILEPGMTITAVATVATPFENGYVKGDREFVVRAVPSDPDGNATGTPIEVPLHAAVEGFYVPGPSPALVLVGLAALALIARRK